MELYLIRHADALPLGERGVTNDEERPLSEIGATQCEAAAKALQTRGIVLDKLYTSPLLRARQTAELLVRAWGQPELMVETCAPLAPGGKPRRLSKQILKSAGAKIGLVGHQPDLGDYAAWLLGYKKAQIDLPKAGVLLIQCGEMPGKGMGALQWMVTPDWF